MTTESTSDPATHRDPAAASEPVDEQRAAAFEGEMVDMLNAGLCLMASIGHRTGLFDAMARSGSVTIETLAADTGLHERYVTEWLGAMTAGRIIDHDPPPARTHCRPSTPGCSPAPARRTSRPSLSTFRCSAG